MNTLNQSLFPELIPFIDPNTSLTDEPHGHHAVGLAAYFRAGVDPQEIGTVYHLSQSLQLLQAFSALFHGGQDAALVRVLVLRELASESLNVTRADINARFAYLLPDTLETIIGRLRQYQLLLWDNAQAVYRVSPMARNILSALDGLLNQSLEDDADLGFVLSQVAGAQVLGGVSVEQLQHLLGRLLDLTEEFRDAIASGSEFRLKLAQEKWHLACDWVEKGSEVIRLITSDARADAATHNAAQAIGRAQSALLNMQGMFSHALTQIERQRVHLGQSGLSTSDIKTWLLNHPDLASLADGAIASGISPIFITPGEMLDVAETELLQATIESLPNELPVGEEVVMAQDHSRANSPALSDWLSTLSNFVTLTHENGDLSVQPQVALQEVLLPANFAIASYRASLLPLMGDQDEASLQGDTAILAKLPLTFMVQDKLVKIKNSEVKAMSLSHLHLYEKTATLQTKDLPA